MSLQGTADGAVKHGKMRPMARQNDKITDAHSHFTVISVSILLKMKK